MNSKEIHKFFKSCREYLMGKPFNQQPELYLLMSPVRDDAEEHGLINVLVKFNPSMNYVVSADCVIGQNGVYSVPGNDLRKKLLPLGVYTSFQLHAMEAENAWLTGPAIDYKPLEPAPYS